MKDEVKKGRMSKRSRESDFSSSKRGKKTRGKGAAHEWEASDVVFRFGGGSATMDLGRVDWSSSIKFSRSFHQDVLVKFTSQFLEALDLAIPYSFICRFSSALSSSCRPLVSVAPYKFSDYCLLSCSSISILRNCNYLGHFFEGLMDGQIRGGEQGQFMLPSGLFPSPPLWLLC